MPDDKRSELIRRLSDEIRADVDDEVIQGLPDETLEDLSEAYLAEIESLEHESGKTLQELLEEEEVFEYGPEEVPDDESYAAGSAAADEIPDEEERYEFEGSG